MDKFIKHFRRKDAGIWECFEAATLMLPEGRVQVAAGTVFTKGTSFMGIDMAELLDAEHKKEERRKALR